MQSTYAFSGFSVDNLTAAKNFYTGTLGIHGDADEMGLHLKLPGGAEVFVYDKPNHAPASFTILNFVVSDIDKVVDELVSKGVQMEQYHSQDMPQDEKGILRGRSVNMGPDIAWFKDPAGNILSVMQQD